MKKLFKPASFILALALLLALAFGSAPDARAAAFYSDVRVLVSLDSVKTLELAISGGYTVKEDASFSLSSGATVSVSGSRPVLTSGGATLSAPAITLVSPDYGGVSASIRFKNSKYGSCTYLGNLSFDMVDGSLRAINTLPVETYLYGVVPYEMSNTFPIEALKAQAVCARGYAVANCSKSRRRAYDIVDTSADQVYHGYNGEYTRAISAVDETAGQVLTYRGDIIQAYYSASNGGQTELTGNVWANNLPYYLQQDDPYDLANPSSMEELSFIPGEFTDKTLPLMDALVLSTLQQLADEAAGAPVTLVSTVRVKARNAVYDPPSRCYTQAEVVLMVQTADGVTGQITVTLTLDDLVYSEEDNPQGIFNTGKARMRMRGAEAGTLEANGETYEGWYITNRRYGHGVGLSQRGAQQRATAGQSYTEILAFYYTGTQLTTIGTATTAPALTGTAYRADGGFVSGMEPGTTPAALLAGLTSDGGTLSVIAADGTKKTAGIVETGDFVRTVYGDGASFYDVPIVVFGDTDGDGHLSQQDLEALRQHLLGVASLAGPYLKAADVNHDGTADALDALRLQRYLQGAAEIAQ